MEKYQGWTNYPTWVTNLWMTNTESKYDYYHNLAVNIYDNSGPTKYFSHKENAILQLKELLKSEFEENIPLKVENGLWYDLLLNSFEMIEWYEIAEHFINEAIEHHEYMEKIN